MAIKVFNKDQQKWHYPDSVMFDTQGQLIGVGYFEEGKSDMTYFSGPDLKKLEIELIDENDQINKK